MLTKRQIMATTLEHLSVELFYEIFIYFQFHVVFHIFADLNSRFATIINNIVNMPVYLGHNGMSIAVTEFYYRYLSQGNISNRLLSLCVSDTLAIDNGLWLAEHISTFLSLRHLCLIDMKRSSFELILNSLSSIHSLNTFRVFFSRDYRAAYTFLGVPEGAYCERFFYLFPSLRVCHLSFYRYIHYTLDSQFALPPSRTFMPVQSSLFNLRSLVLYCSPSFLSYLIVHLPQLDYRQSDPWLPDTHPLRYDQK
jgi:hypothetical protein